MVTIRGGSGWLANEDQNLGEERGEKQGPPNLLVNTVLYLQGCLKMRPLLSHLPRLRKLCSDSGAGMWTLRWEDILLTVYSPSAPYGVPLTLLTLPNLRPTDLPAAPDVASSSGLSLWREVGPVAKGPNHPAPWGWSFRRNLPKSAPASPSRSATWFLLP